MNEEWTAFVKSTARKEAEGAADTVLDAVSDLLRDQNDRIAGIDPNTAAKSLLASILKGQLDGIRLRSESIVFKKSKVLVRGGQISDLLEKAMIR